MGMSTQRNIILQIGIASIWGSGVFLISNTTSNLLGIFGIILCGVCVIIHFIIIEYFGLCRGLPTEWKPSAFFKFVSLKL
jgi:hypothetical protein